jgi:predicted DNA-binding transcriptional regulator AlpA
MRSVAVRLAATPTLADLAAQPERINDLQPAQARACLALLVPLQTALLSRAFAQDGSVGSRGDRLLSVKEAAAKLGQSVAYVYKHAHTFHFAVRNGRALRFSETGIERWIREQQRP